MIDEAERRRLVKEHGAVTLNGCKARLLGWRLDRAMIVTFPSERHKAAYVDSARFDWNTAKLVVETQNGEFTS